MSKPPESRKIQEPPPGYEARGQGESAPMSTGETSPGPWRWDGDRLLDANGVVMHTRITGWKFGLCDECGLELPDPDQRTFHACPTELYTRIPAAPWTMGESPQGGGIIGSDGRLVAGSRPDSGRWVIRNAETMDLLLSAPTVLRERDEAVALLRELKTTTCQWCGVERGEAHEKDCRLGLLLIRLDGAATP